MMLTKAATPLLLVLGLSVALTFIATSCSAASVKRNDRPTYPKSNDPVTVRNGTERWGYVTVRPKAHMFWWLYESTNAKGYNNVPLVLWLQGGPGGSSTGFGNFGEIGPVNVDLKPRNTTWLSVANLLFIDNPVGTGYSYAEDSSAFTTDVEQIAADLLTLFKTFMKINKDMTSVPFYIFSESYGGKMTAAFSQVLYKAVESGEVKCKFEGFAMGDSWISPVDSTFSWGPYLYANSLIDRSQLKKLNVTATLISQLAADGKWQKATEQWSELERQVEEFTAFVNFYNIQKWGGSEMMSARLLHDSKKDFTPLERSFVRHVLSLQKRDLSQLMNGPIRKKLRIIPKNVTWGSQSGNVFAHQEGDFMKPVTDIVDVLINNSTLKVVVYSGQLDLIVDNLGTEAWVYRLKISDRFSRAEKKAIRIDGIPQAFVKEVDNFQCYFILAAGHMVPADNGPAALTMLKRIVGE